MVRMGVIAICGRGYIIIIFGMRGWLLEIRPEGGLLTHFDIARFVCVRDTCKRLEIKVLVCPWMLKKIRIQKVYFSWTNRDFNFWT